MKSTTIELEKSFPFTIFENKFPARESRENIERPVKQYLYFAFRRSLRDAVSYEEAAAPMSGNGRHAFLLEMARRKREEPEKLYSLYQVDGSRVLRDIIRRNIISNPHYQPELDPSSMVSIEDIYSFAFKKEQHNFELYSKLAGLDSNPYTKILFEYLANLEKDHIAFIEEQLVQATARDIWETTISASNHPNA